MKTWYPGFYPFWYINSAGKCKLDKATDSVTSLEPDKEIFIKLDDMVKWGLKTEQRDEINRLLNRNQASPPETMYADVLATGITLRGDHRGPAIICDGGFKPYNDPKATSYNFMIRDHVARNWINQNTLFVSTTRRMDVALEALNYDEDPNKQGAGWIYAVVAHGVDVLAAHAKDQDINQLNQWPVKAHDFALHQSEIAAIKEIPWGNVVMFRQVRALNFTGPLYVSGNFAKVTKKIVVSANTQLFAKTKVRYKMRACGSSGVCFSDLLRLMTLFGIRVKDHIAQKSQKDDTLDID